ncbi:MAG: hypothetical protein PHU95_00540 [Candidatus Thermoplasmatota archaeon]|nr:hypothetical protein [Candidatus Thermoplasmatota archaeon]MDD5777925.1 hypothetical protein [Candidatus Thermoplasmatota archaeon]
MLKKSITFGVLLGTFMLLSTAVFAPMAEALDWGAMSASPNVTPYYIDRYGSGSLTLTVSYSAFFFQYFPVWVEINVVRSPSWLTVTPSQKTFVLQKDESKPVKISMALSQQDVYAGSLETVEFEVTGRIILGGEVRQIATGKADIQVGVNPYTQVTLQIAKPIERTAPDRELTFPITVKNWGNADTTVTLSLTDDDLGGWKYIINPQQILLPGKKPGDANPPEEVASLTLTSPHGTAVSYHNDWQGIALQAVARTQAKYYVLQGSQFEVSQQDKETVTVFNAYATMLAKNKGFYLPGFEAVILIGALAAIVLVMRRKRQ